MSLKRRIRRLLLIPRARRVALERQFLDLGTMLDKIREVQDKTPPWQRRLYSDDV